LRGVAGRREDQLRALRSADAAASSALLRIRTDEWTWEAAEETVDGARREQAAADSVLESAVAELTADVAQWSAAWGVAVPEAHLDALVTGQRMGVGPLLSARRRELADRRSAVSGERALVADRRATAAVDRARVEAETDLAPPARPGRPAQRPAGFVPLWACVDFDPSLSPAQRARLEAGLEASGVLDALVGPDGQVLDGETLDTLVIGAPGPGSVAGLIAAAPHTGAAARALAAFATAGTWTLDGRWTFGPLAGYWAKPSAEYIGAAARADNRRRRILELTADIEAADAKLARITQLLAELDSESDRLDAAETAWPSTDALLLARQEQQRCATVLGQALSAAERARDQLAQARAEGQAALDALASASEAARCTAGEVDEVLAAVGAYREALIEAVAAVKAAVTARQAAAEASVRAAQSETRAVESKGAATRTRAAATSAAAEEAELRRTSGADAAEVLARQRELQSQLEQSGQEQTELRSQRDSARDQVAASDALLSSAEEDKAERERVRGVGPRAAGRAGLH
jgi:hypothetical protein